MQEKLIINAEEAPIRLDKFLASRLDHLSRMQVQELINAGQVTCNGVIVNNCASKIKTADYEINLSFLKEKPTHLEAYDLELDIIYEDEYLLVINKPAGLIVHPGAGNYDKTMANALVNYAKDSLSKLGGEFRPGIVHRLDKDTSGLIIVAKDDYTHRLLSEALAARDINRYYLALVFGCPDLKAGTIRTFMDVNKRDHTKRVVTRNTGKEAITHYNVVHSYLDGQFSLLECKLDTGRTHQIRVHLNYKNLPVIGDPSYNEAQKKYLSKLDPEIKALVTAFPRQALHAYKLEFTHPITEEFLQFEIALPEDMQSLVDDLTEEK